MNIFRPYGKKRGHRRTGSPLWGSAGVTLFFSAIFLTGCALLGWLLTATMIPEWQMNHRFQPVEAQVIDTRIAERHGSLTVTFRPEVRISYQVDGRTYTHWKFDLWQHWSHDRMAEVQRLKPFTAGKKITCWYDPQQPERAVVERGYSTSAWLLLLVPISFIVIGVGGLSYQLVTWGPSVEHKAALATQAQQWAPFADEGQDAPTYPGVPKSSSFNDSPGTSLRFRLPAAGTSGRLLLIGLLSCLGWNGFVIACLAVAVTDHFYGQHDWYLTLFLFPAGALGYALGLLFFRQLRQEAGYGATWVEISDHPLVPGRRYEVVACQSAPVAVDQLRVLLVCEEEAAYQQGTNTRLDTARVQERQLLVQPVTRDPGDTVQELRSAFSVPEESMHSFSAGHNHIYWKLLVQGQRDGWPDVERVFPLVVNPSPITAPMNDWDLAVALDDAARGLSMLRMPGGAPQASTLQGPAMGGAVAQIHSPESNLVSIALNKRSRQYYPKEELVAEVQLDRSAIATAKALEVSVVWQTEGKGDEDLAVHFFERVLAEQLLTWDHRTPQRFRVTLPLSPFTYHGFLVKIRWCVRTRLFLPHGKHLVTDADFRLGTIPAPRIRYDQPDDAPPAEEAPRETSGTGF